MKKLIVIILTIVSYNAVAQTQLIGIKGGVSQTNIFSYEPTIRILESYQKSRTGFSGGITYEYLINNKFSLGADFIYNQRGYISGELNFSKSLYTYDFLSIPIKAYYNYGKKIIGFFDLGFIPSILIDAKSTTTYYYSREDRYSYNVTKDNKMFDFAGIGEIGIGYKLKKMYLYSSMSMQWSINTINDHYYTWGSRDYRHNGRTLSLGVKYALDKSK